MTRKVISIGLLLIFLVLTSCQTTWGTLSSSEDVILNSSILTQDEKITSDEQVSELPEEYSSETIQKKVKPKISRYDKRKSRVIEETKSRGIYGRLYIDSVSIDVALFIDENDILDIKQKITDNYDSACLFKWKANNYAIGDHNYQSFKRLNKCKLDDEALIITTGVDYKYICVDIIPLGYNITTDLLVEDGITSLVTYYTECLIIYTCVQGTSNGVFISVWQEIG